MPPRAPRPSDPEVSASEPSTAVRGLRGSRTPSVLAAGAVALALALGAGFLAGRASLDELPLRPGYSLLEDGPWGEIEVVPITIAAPTELLKVRGVDQEPMHWLFPGATRREMEGLLEQVGVAASARARWLAPPVFAQFPEGVSLTPSCDLVRGLSALSRDRMYAALSERPVNNVQRWEFPLRYLDSFAEMGGARDGDDIIRAYGVRHGNYIVSYAMQCVFGDIKDYAGRAGVMKALTQQSSMIARLRVRPDSDVEALTAYWGRGQWSADVRAILESIRRLPRGGSIDLIQLLPPFPSSLLHTYPKPLHPQTDEDVPRNCSWTSFNFFRDVPDPAFALADVVLARLEQDYRPVLSDPRYGDIAVILNARRQMVHVAVYLADDLYFTKNGDNPWHPWVLSTSEAMLEMFSYGLPEGTALQMLHYRSKL